MGRHAACESLQASVVKAGRPLGGAVISTVSTRPCSESERDRVGTGRSGLDPRRMRRRRRGGVADGDAAGARPAGRG